MSASEEQVASALRASVKEAELLRLRNQALLEASSEPVAILGMACRYPGGISSPRELWNLAKSGIDAISGFPADRGWDLERLYDPDPDHPGTSYVREGGFLADAAGFDPAFFGMVPHEALESDPQQRLLLEVCWEALEDGGIVPSSLRRTQTGVFAGAMYGDYGWGRSPMLDQVVSHASSAGSVISGRIAYALGLEGPALTVDTACSSSLVALHLAAQALRHGDCSLALAGGATVLSTPNSFIAMSRQRAFAPDGRSKSFADAADGVGWSEGVGVLVLERLSDAERNGHPILATIRGSAVNQDGASNGLTAPNGPSQERVIRQALANAGLQAKDVDVVEAHGTGTPLGDPIEAGALLATYGREREAPLKLGSIKSNIGHTQAAAGVAGVIKMVMAMREGVLPKTLHVDSPSAKIDWSVGDIELLSEAVEWDNADRPRRAAVSAFGVSGTNAHLVLEQAPPPSPAEKEPPGEAAPSEAGAVLPGPIPLPLSAKSEPALRAQAQRLLAHLRESPDLDPLDAGFSLATGRTAFEHRAVALGADREQLLTGLEALARGEESPRLVRGVAGGDRRPVFLFGGYGSQWPKMARELCLSSPAFAAHLRACEEALAPHVDFSLLDNLRGEDEGWLERGDIVQAILFALTVSLTRLWQGLGVSPVAVAGTSQGEVAAAHIAGALSLEDAAHLAAARGRMIYSLAGQGRMISVALPAERLEARIEQWGGRIEIAALNGPSSTILSGDEEATGEVLAQLEEEGVRARGLRGGVAASHSAQVEVLHDEIIETFASLSPRSSDIPFYSTVEGGLIDTRELNAEYWYRNLRQPVRLEQVTRGLLDSGYRLLIEPSPHPVLGLAVEETIEAALDESGDAIFLGTLRRGEGGTERMAISLSEAHANGAEVDWPAFFAGSGAGRVPLPTYPFQRRRFWLDPAAGDGDLQGAGLDSAEHPLLGAAVTIAEGDGVLLTGRLSLATHPWLGDHVYEVALLPGTAFVELALRAGAEVGCESLEELTLEAPLVLPEEGAVTIQVSVSEPGEQGRRELSVLSRPGGEGEEWTRHAIGVLSPVPLPAPEPIGSWPPEGAQPLEIAGVYDRLAEQGLLYGPAFQCLDAAWQRGDDLFVEASLPGELSEDAQRFGLHPALLDASGHVGFDLAVKAAAESEESGLALPFAWRGVRHGALGASSMRLRVSPVQSGHSMVAVDEAGALIVAVDSIVLRPTEPGRLRDLAERKPLYGLKWVAQRADPEGAGQRLAVLGSERLDGVEAEHYEHLPALLEALEGGADVPDAVLVAASRPAEEQEELLGATHREARRVQALLRAWVSVERLQRSRLVFLSEGAEATEEGERPRLASASALGLIRSAQSEYPGLFATIDSDGSKRSSEALPVALADTGEPRIALREGRLLVPRLTRVRTATEDPPAEAIDPDSTVLITGGLSGIGAEVARHLAGAHGARHLLLTSRSGEKAALAAELRAELEEIGAGVSIAACDVSDREQLQALLDSIPSEHPLGAVVHSAAVLADGMLESQDADRLERVMRPKVDAAWHLHELTEELELSQFLLFSSAAGVFGSPGQGNYAAANSFLDSLAHLRRAKGLPATSLAWGLWKQKSNLAGGASEQEVESMERQIHQRFGVMPMAPERGLQLFDSARALSQSVVVPVQFDFGVMRPQAQEGILPAILTGLVRVPGRRRQDRGSLAARLASVPEAERRGVCLDLVRTHVAAVLGLSSTAEIEPDRAFRELGFDSLGAVELRNRLSTASGLRLPATVVFDYPTANALGDFLLTATGVELRAPAVAAPRSSAPDEPIAIVGMSCRYPGGVSSPKGLWELASSEVDAISGFPADRGWDLERLYDPDPDRADTCYAREGGFLADAADFDSAFFRISPREAEMMDPQERLLLEACWEALEDAAIDPASLRGSQAGVFAGVMYQDYGPLPGLTSSSVTGRVAYSFGLEGPTMSIDTACSSSLVAMHLASQALRQGESDLALAGGVAIASTPAMLRFFSRQRGLSPDGRSKPFAEAADGVGFSEGVGMLVLERLSDAERNGHPVLATIRGSAVNQDGASNGLTAPNGPSQERVIRQALANAGLQAKDVDAVEAHGTGTTLGDPIEAGALLATYGQDRETPLKLGSIKSNIGHAQAAAGVAGVIKMVMAMREGVLPKTLHVDSPSSKIEWSAGDIELLTEAAEWNAGERPRRAGVSSFGASGTNAHVVLEQAPPPGPAEEESPRDPGSAKAGAALPGPIPLVLSARSESALPAQAERLLAHLRENPDLDPLDVGYSLATTRGAFEHRGVALGSAREELLAALASIAAGSPSANAITARSSAGKLACLFSGQGSQRAGMGRELYESYPVYRDALQGAFAELDPHLERPLGEIVFAAAGSEEASLLDRTAYAQPALFATEVALFRLLEAFGLAPDLLAGHSIGEITAAHLAGALSLPGASQLVAARGKLMDALPAGGAMVAIEASEAEAAEAIAGSGEELAVAAINAPGSTVVSGAGPALAGVQAHFEELGRRTKRLAVSHAFHSPLIEPMLEQFAAVVREVELRDPEMPVVSNTSGGLLRAGEATDPAYWVAHARQAVRFADGISTLLGQGVSTLLEIGPGGALAAMTRECLEAGGGAEAKPATVIPTLREGRPEPEAIVHALGQAHAAGAKIDWGAFFAPVGARRVPLPTYSFQRRRYWLDSASIAGDVGGAGLSSAEHPLLGASVELAAGEGEDTVFTGRLSLSTHRWLADHTIGGAALVPGTALLELALEAGAQLGAETVEELTLQAPLVLPEGDAVQIQLGVTGADQEGRRQLVIHSRLDDSLSDWTLNAEGVLGSSSAPATGDSLGAWPPEGAEQMDTEGVYDLLAEHGVEYGPSFQGLVAAWRAGGTVYAELSLGEDHGQEATRFRIHPALLDAAAHALIDPAGDGPGSSGLEMPFAWQGVRLHRRGAAGLRVRISPGAQGSSLVGFDEAGEPAISIEAALSRPVEPGRFDSASRSLYRVEWKAAQPPSSNGTLPRFAILGEVEDPGLDAERHADLDAFVASIEAGEGAADAIVVDFRTTGADGDLPAAALEASARALDLAKAWAADEPAPGARLTFLTQGAVSGAAGSVSGLASSPLWGLVRSAQSEHPGRFALVDVDGSSAALASLPAALVAGAQEPQLAIRGGELLAPRLARVGGEASGQPIAEPIEPGETVLITGGTTGLGATVARHLVANGARHLLLASRRGGDVPGAVELQAELEQLGAETVRIAACDVADREQLEALLDSIERQHPLGAVVHSAAVVDDGVLGSLDAERLAGVMAPKAEAAWHLHELTREMGLSRFVLFSSVAGVLGGPGQANYAAASTFLDALAAHRRAEGLAATSLAWGAIRVESDLLAEAELKEVTERVRLRGGLVPMSPERALALFDTSGALGESLLVPAEFDWAVLRARAKDGPVAPLFRDLIRATVRSVSEQGSLVERLAGVPEGEREALVVDLVRGHAAAVLGHASAEAVEPDRAFQELGFDSLAAVELRNRLGVSTGLSLSPTLVFDYPSATAIAAYLLAEISPGSGDAGDADEIAFREALARTPISRLREAGLMEDLIEIVGFEAGSAKPPVDESIERIDSMDAVSLIERTLEEAKLAGGEGE